MVINLIDFNHANYKTFALFENNIYFVALKSSKLESLKAHSCIPFFPPKKEKNEISTFAHQQSQNIKQSKANE